MPTIGKVGAKSEKQSDPQGVEQSPIPPNFILVFSCNAGNRQTVFGGKVLTYDDNGNLTRITDGTDITELTWDSQDPLTSLSAPGATTATFGYAALGRQAAKTINGTTTSSSTIGWIWRGR